jgi:drug/metabolite transporter (DMT)-like permease
MQGMTNAETAAFAPPNSDLRATNNRAKAPLLVPALLACYLVWGSTYLAIRYALLSFPPFLQMGSRFLVAGALLMSWVVFTRQPMPSRNQWRNALVVGSLMLGGGMGLIASAEQHVGSGLIAAFVAAFPMIASGIGLFFGKRPTRLEWIGMAIGLLGVLLLARGASFAAAPSALIASLAAIFFWSLGSTLSTTRLPIAPGPAGFASEMLCGGAVLMVISLALGEHRSFMQNGPLRPEAVWALAYLVVFGSLIAFTAYLYLLAHATPSVATSYAFVNPVIAIVLGAFLAGEKVHGDEWLACAVILIGVILIFRGKSATRSAK